jgi:hypothetical protein
MGGLDSEWGAFPAAKVFSSKFFLGVSLVFGVRAKIDIVGVIEEISIGGYMTIRSLSSSRIEAWAHLWSQKTSEWVLTIVKMYFEESSGGAKPVAGVGVIAAIQINACLDRRRFWG